MNSEQEVRLHFLDEANDYLAQIETGVLGLSKPTNRQIKTLDSTLRAAHSIKGGAAMMGYELLRNFAHRLEDFLKVIRASQASQVDAQIEELLLESVDCLRKVIHLYHQDHGFDESWLETKVNPIFEALHSHLGDPQIQDTTKLVSAETGEDITALLFQTEVDSCLQRLEEVLNSPQQICLKEEFTLAAQELGGLGEMLDLKNFTALCGSINDYLKNAHDLEVAKIARLALKAWQRSQALVLVGQVNNLPSSLELEEENGKTLTQNETQELIPNLAQLSEALSLDSEEFELSTDWSPEQVPHWDIEQISEDFSFLSQDNFLDNFALTPELEKPQIETFAQEDNSEIDSSTNLEGIDTDNTVRVAVRQLEQLSDLVGELTIERNGLNLQLAGLRDLLNLLKTKVKTLYYSNSNIRTLYDNTSNWDITRLNLGINSQIIPDKKGQLAENRIEKNNHALIASVNRAFSSSSNNFLEHLRSELDDHLEMDRYGEEHLFLQELMENIVQIQEVTEDIDLKLEDATRKARHLSRTSDLVQNQVTQVRMRPFSDLVKGFPRAIREMELKYGKQVQLKISGSSTLIDRTILEALKDPVVHLIRNAFDHGIEKSDERLKKGKPAVGTIEVNATYRGNQTVITLKDDGAGINFEKIRLAAFEMGLEESMLVKASQKELLDLIFEPGFTTTSEVTDLSGRGVGMDIVRTQVKQIRGQIHIDTVPEKGTTFTISVPFTLSVVRVLLLESRGILLAIPSSGVEEMLIVSEDMVVTSSGVEYLRWDDSMMPLYSLRDWLHFARPYVKPQTEASAKINQPVVLIIAQGNEQVALQMDSYWGEQEVSIRGIEGPIKLPTGFTGCTILGDGRVVPLVDNVGLLRLIEQGRSGKETAVPWMEPETSRGNSPEHSWGQVEQFDELLLQEPTHSTPLEKTTVMVVDDSINIRRFLALMLEKAGYRVQQAKDGQDALEQLKKGLPIAAVICDIEMPRLDGYGFLAHVKSDPLFRSLPVMMLTSRSGEKHRQIALNLGASAYFTKPFQAQELLQTLESVI